MKIVQIIDRLEVGGAERVLVDLTNLLHENKYNVSVLCLLEEGQLDAQLNSEIPITYIRRKHKFNPKYLFRLYKKLLKYDIIHIHLRQVLRYVSLLFYITRLHKRSVIIFQDHFGNIAENKSISYSIKCAIKRCGAYIGVSEELVFWARKNKLNTKIYKLANIIRHNQTKPQPKRTDFSLVKVVSVGNFRPQKNYEFLLDLIKTSPENYHYTIYGQPVDNTYFKKIKTKINDLKIVKKVSLVTDCNNIKSELYNYDIAIHSAKSETGPLVAIEYLSENLPFVAYDTGEVAKLVKSEFNEFIQKDFEIRKWLINIERLLKHKKTLEPQLKLFYNQNYSEALYLKSSVLIYRELLHSSKN